jgi:hypothetical protein
VLTVLPTLLLGLVAAVTWRRSRAPEAEIADAPG